MSSESPPENLFKTDPSNEDREWFPPKGLESFGRSRRFQRGRGGRGRFQRGNIGGFVGGRGRFHSGRGGFVRGWGSFGRGRGGFERGRVGFGRGRGGFERGRGGFGFVRGRGGFERGRGGFRGVKGFSHVQGTLRERVKKLPLYQIALQIENLQDPVPEVGDYSVKNLCSFLETVLRKHYEFPEIDELWNKRVIILQNSQGRIVDPLEKKSVFHKVIESLPKPTLKESLVQATDYLCGNCKFKLLQNEHPEWPKNDWPSLISVIRDETPDDLKEISLTAEQVVSVFPKMGRLIMFMKMRDLRRKRNLAYAAFFKKYPELFPWTNKTIIEGDTYIEGKDS